MAERPAARRAAPATPPTDEVDASRMPFLAHLRELRDRVRNASIAFVIAFIGCYIFSTDIYDWLRVPLDDAWRSHKDVLGNTPLMNFKSVTEPFWVYLSVSLWAGIFAASPFIFHQLWQFIAPGLYKRERRIGIAFAATSALLFIAGGAFCYYFALEPMFTFLLGYAGSTLHPQLMMSEHLELSRNMMLAFGAVFELPLLILFLAGIGLVTHRSLWKFNRWFIVLAFIIGAILTPSPDPVAQVIMALPMVVLYNLSILGAFIVTRRRERAQAADGGPTPARDEDEDEDER
ncbi:MAG: twin-arginine translocase subunit TatC [Kofleriaceae bacterium]